MQILLRLTSFYLLLGGAFVFAMRPDAIQKFVALFQSIPVSLEFLAFMTWWLIPAFGAMLVLAPGEDKINRISRVIVTVVTCAVFSGVFSLVKTAMPLAVPFWADPLLAWLDMRLHFGHDPWSLTHALIAPSVGKMFESAYYTGWLVTGIYLPAIIVAFDTNQERIKRFVWLYVFTWVVIGNLFAIAAMSAGPVFYDNLFGGARFEGLLQALQDSGLSTSRTGQIQGWLWQAYAENAQNAGSGISAFPSVHVGMTTVVALYIYERQKRLLPLSVMLIAAYAFFSVYFGWHYAVDGYFSILFVVMTWIFLKRRSAKLSR